MSFAAFFERERRVLARRPATFWGRMTSAALPALWAAGCVATWDYWGWDRTSVAGAAAFGLALFGLVVGGSAGPLLGMVPSLAAPAIAVERERKTIDALLATPLESLEIVLGVLCAKLLPCLVAFGAMLPILVLVAVIGGIDPRWAVLATGGVASTCVTLAAMGVAVSAGTRTGRRAIGYSLIAFGMWTFVPGFVLGVFARGWPTWALWARPVMLWVLDSSPFVVVTHVAGLIRRTSLPGAVLRMMGLQLAITVGLVAWASWRLRPASRALHDGDGRAFLRRTLWVRRRQRPPCGDDPILWKEIHSIRIGNELARRIEFCCQAVWVGALALATARFAVPAFGELLERGYRASSEAMSITELHPGARVLVQMFSPFGSGPATGQARLEFNIVLRQMSALFSFIFVLVVAGHAAEGVTSERERDTWDGLLVTPLTGAEILRAKMLGALWRSREVAAWMLGIWTVGLCCGALHPIGLGAAVVQLAASGAFSAAVGTYASLRSSSRDTAVARAVWAPMLLALSGMILVLAPSAAVSVLVGAGSPPFLTWASLVSYEDVASTLHANRFPQLAAAGMKTGEGSARVAAAWLLGTSIHAAAAVVVMRKAFREFDAAVGRPSRRPPRNDA